MWNPFSHKGKPAPPTEFTEQESIPFPGEVSQVHGSVPNWMRPLAGRPVAQSYELPDPAIGNYATDTNSLVWSDGYGKMFPHRQPFNGDVLDPNANALAGNAANGPVGMNTQIANLGTALQNMYFSPDATQQDISTAYNSYFGS